MKEFDISGLNRAFENRVRLGIMSLLAVSENIEFNRMKEMLRLTDGNLSSHASALEKSGYISVKKEFSGRKPRTTYQITAAGRQAFTAHLDFLAKLLEIGSGNQDRVKAKKS